MKPVVIRNIKRADSNAIGTLAAVGVSTAHEALGRSGLMKPYMRPVWAGAPSVKVVCSSLRRVTRGRGTSTTGGAAASAVRSRCCATTARTPCSRR